MEYNKQSDALEEAGMTVSNILDESKLNESPKYDGASGQGAFTFNIYVSPKVEILRKSYVDSADKSKEVEYAYELEYKNVKDMELEIREQIGEALSKKMKEKIKMQSGGLSISFADNSDYMKA
jgi:hypothetical protein